MFITLRPTQPEDEAFLFALYCSARSDELAMWGWEADQDQPFLKMQFRAHQQHYRSIGPQAEQRTICRMEEPIGQIITYRDGQSIHLAYIALLPEQRNVGIGASLISDLLGTAKQAALSVRLDVRPGNPAVRLYTRLGFVVTASNTPSLEMEWQP